MERNSIKAALQQAGIKSGDIVLVHAALFSLGLPQEPISDLNEYYVNLLQEVVGPNGTLIFPAFSYSFCKRQPFDPKSTLSTVSGLANYCIKHRLGYRSADPLFSYIALGKDEQLPPMSNICFDDQDGIYSYLIARQAKYLMLGKGLFFTLKYTVEECLDTPNRFLKAFSGTWVNEGQEEQRTAYYYCRYNTDRTKLDQAKFDAFIDEQIKVGLCQRVPLGQCYLSSCDIAAMCETYRQVLLTDPWAHLIGPAQTRAQMEAQIPDTYHVTVERHLYPAVKLGD